MHVEPAELYIREYKILILALTLIFSGEESIVGNGTILHLLLAPSAFQHGSQWFQSSQIAVRFLA